MKTISQTYKDNIKQLGKEITYEITYDNTTLGDEDILNANLHYDGGLLKSVMKQLDIELYNDIPIGTELNYKFGVKTRDGKNLFNFNGFENNGTGRTTFTTTDESITINATSGGTYRYVYKRVSDLIIGETYTISIVSYTDTNASHLAQWGVTNTSGTFYNGVKTLSSVQTITFTPTENVVDIRFGYLSNSCSTGDTLTINQVQLELGSSATEYEEYGMYDYIDYGNFVVYSSEKQEDSGSYKLVCYDKMLYAMKDYENMQSKNIFDESTIIMGDYKTANATIRASSRQSLYLEAGIYTFSTTLDLTTYGVAIDILPNTPPSTSYNTIQSTGYIPSNTYTFAVNEAGYFVITLKKGNNATFTLNEVNGFHYQLEKGSTATTFENFFETKYPITIRDYIQKICDWLGFTFKNATETFPNYDKTIENELYLDTDGNSLNYTFRDVLTELAQATGSTICINDNDELELRYINDTGTTTEIEGTSLNFTTQGIRPQSEVKLEAQTLSQNGTPTPTNPVLIETITGENTIKVEGLNVLNPSNFVSSTEIPSIDRATNIITININSKNNFATIFDNLNIPIGNYTIWAKIESGTYTGGNLCYYDLNDTKYTSEFNFRVSTYYYHQFNASNGLKQLRIYAPSATSEVKLKLWIVRGSYTTDTMPTYEPYKGNSYEINLGKNLLNPTGISDSQNGITFTNNGDGTFTANGTATANTTFSLTNLATTPIRLEANKPYTQTLYVLSGTWGGSVVPAFKNNGGTITYNYFNNNATSPYQTKTPTENMTCHTYYYYVPSGATATNCTFRVQLEQNNLSTEYTPYFEPIEYCKIGDYKDEFIRTTGKNLWNEEFEIAEYDTSGNKTSTTVWVVNKNKIVVKPNTTYTISQKEHPSQYRIIYFNGNTYISRENNNTNTTTGYTSYTFTTPNNCNGIYIQFRTTIERWATGSSAVGVGDITEPQLEVGSSATTYEPYGKNEWWLKKAIGKVVLDGSEANWATRGGGTTYAYSCPNIFDGNKTSGLCSHWNFISGGASNSQTLECIASANTNTSLNIFTNNSSLDTLSNFKTWLGTNKPIIYYVLATPTYTKLDNTDLINQLEATQKLKLFYGINNIIQSNTDLPIKLKFSYTNTLDTIDEEYLKDINVNFGEMTKPINTITFKRSGDSDAISLSYPEDLDDELKNEIAISDNQILAYDNRDEYLQDILDQLYGISYAINDYSSTGITFYDLCDRYNASITKTDDEGNTLETNLYPCIMLNDEINVNQGLEEMVHTDLAEESTTDYNTTTKTDRLEKRTSLVVNKQEGYIEAITGELGMVDGQSQVIQGIRDYQDENSKVIEAITSFDEDGNATGVRTVKGFTFDKNGLNITSSSNEYKTKIDETGTFYYDGDTELGRTTKDGSAFRDMELYGEFYYGKDEYDETSLFVSMLYNDGTEECFGHFYNGREVE